MTGLGLAARTPAAPPAAPAGARVVVRGATRRFGDVVALDGVDLTVEPGTCTVILGPSGCGKTTLLRCLAGLEHPSSGTIEIGGEDVTGREPGRRPVGMVFQDFGLYPDKSARGNIEFPLRIDRVPARKRAARVEEVAGMLRIPHLLERRPRELSGGQRQRVGIGRAIARTPGVLLMDEPLSALDAALRTELRGELHGLRSALGTTMVYVTHDQVEAMSLADQLVVMREGRIEQVGDPDEVYARPVSTFVARFLGDTSVLDAVVGPGGVVHLGTGGADGHGDGAALPAHLDVPAGTRVSLGVRPHDLDLVAAGDAAPGALTVPVRVELVERTGAGSLVHVRTPAGGRLRVGSRAPRHRLREADRVVVDPGAVLVFDEADRLMECGLG